MKASKTCRKLLNDYGGATRVEMFWIYKDVATVVCEHQVRQKKSVCYTHEVRGSDKCKSFKSASVKFKKKLFIVF